MVFILIFSIYLFIYSNWCKQKQMEPTTYFYLLIQIGCWLHVVFVLIFIIYLFIYSKRCQQKEVEPTTCFYLLMEIICWLHVFFHFNIQYLFVYLLKAMSTKAGGTEHLFLFTYANRWRTTCGFRFNIHYLFVYFFKVMSTKAVQVTTCFHLLMQIASCYGWLTFNSSPNCSDFFKFPF